MNQSYSDARYYSVKQYGIGSWLDPRSRSRLAATVGERLSGRCKGEAGVVLTLTYDRSAYKSARDLYCRQSEEQHVPLFIRRLSRRIGVNLKGKWFRKLEFQSGGYVHFHLIILGVKRIEFETLKEAWGHGHVFVQRLTDRGARYLCKYVAKTEDDIPAFILADRPRSFKVIAVSPGFWRADEDDDEPPRGTIEEPCPSTTLPVYVSLGQKLEDAQHLILIEDLETGFQRRISVDMGCFLLALKAQGIAFYRGGHGRIAFIASESEHLLPAIEDALNGHSRDAGGVPPASGLPLWKTSNPDAQHPRWLQQVILDGMSRAA